MAVKNIPTPDFGGATDVTVIEVLVKPGDQVQPDSTIMTLESDKATMDLPAGVAGVVKELKVKVGDKVNTGDILLIVESAGGEQAKAPETAEKMAKEPEKKAEKQPSSPPNSEPQQEAPKQVLTGTLQTSEDTHAGPGVRRFARELGVNLTQVVGTGPKQRIIKEDVQAYVKNQLSGGGLPALSFGTMPTIDFAKFGPTTVEPLSRLKKLSGKNLQRNWMMIPHVTQFAEADITTLEEFRISQKKELERDSVKLTPLVFIMKAVVASLKAFPFFNASLDTSGENLIVKKYFHIGIAVDTPDGLIVPVAL